ncbi:MAG TPA: hypothetical protein PLI45_00420 [Candidatus Woesebacteria bacterium]|nr:hypothetical protein [Candidatus Woesebacteria bacterium]
MTQDMFDLFVRVDMRLDDLKENISGDKNAFVSGVITGLSLGLARIRSSLVAPEACFVDLLANGEMNLSDLIHEANSTMPVGYFCDEKMFYKLIYRLSPSGKYYSEGIRLGFNYVFELSSARGVTGLTDSKLDSVKGLVGKLMAELMKRQF